MRVARGEKTTIAGRHAHSVRGSITVLFMVMVIPLFFALLTLTIDLSHYFGIRDELQRVIDREAHDALVFGKTSNQIQDTIRTRMGTLGGMAEITSVQATRTRGRQVIFVDGTYRGAFAEVAQRLYGKTSQVLTFAARAEVSMQPSAALIILDRSAIPAGSECNHDGLAAMGLFVDRLADTWVQTAGTAVSVGVFPGETAPAELLAGNGVDQIPRCRGVSSATHIDASSVRGAASTGGFSATSFAFKVQELVAQNLITQPVEVRSVVFVVNRATFDAGYSALAYSFVKNLVAETYYPIDFYTVVLDDTGFIDSRPFVSGINGGAFREVTASRTDLRGLRLLSATAQTITDRIVLER